MACPRARRAASKEADGPVWEREPNKVRSSIASERIGLRRPVHVAGRGGVPVKMVLCPLMVGNDHLRGRGIGIEQTRGLRTGRARKSEALVVTLRR